jgi:hypothetical protein
MKMAFEMKEGGSCMERGVVKDGEVISSLSI